MKEHQDACRKCAKEKSATAEHVCDNGYPRRLKKLLMEETLYISQL